MVPRMMVSLGRIKDVLDTKLTIHDPKYPKELPIDNSIEFKKLVLSMRALKIKY